jgi:alkane 1-monooxygenase
MNWNLIKYLLIFTGPIIGMFSLSLRGWWTWALPIYAYVCIPILDFIIPKSEANFSSGQEENLKKNRLYDYLLYSLVPLQYFLLIYYLFSVSNKDLELYEMAGRIVTFAISCVTIGINVAHELGHRVNKYEQNMAKALLLTSQYMHFIIEHNKGHHKRVATEEDPASARYGESLYAFWIRSIVFSYLSAWKLETERLKKKNLPVWSFQNEMLQFAFLQLTLILLVFTGFGLFPLLYYLASALLGILFFETVNYLEHYGLRRRKIDENKYERVLPVHSWNSNHFMGRAILFEVTRHSDHHFLASRKYQILRHFDEAPQLPAGYPAMILLAFTPPLWFYVMHRHIEKIKRENPIGIALA